MMKNFLYSQFFLFQTKKFFFYVISFGGIIQIFLYYMFVHKTVATENGKLNSAKSKVEMACRELQKNSLQISETNKQIIDEATKNRDEITQTFEKNLESVKSIEEEIKTYDKENET